MTNQEWIIEAANNDRAALLDGIKGIYNCLDAYVDVDGRVWMSNPQVGHWLDDDGIARIVKSLKAGDI